MLNLLYLIIIQACSIRLITKEGDLLSIVPQENEIEYEFNPIDLDSDNLAISDIIDSNETVTNEENIGIDDLIDEIFKFLDGEDSIEINK